MDGQQIRRWWHDEGGATALEYALIAALVAMVALVGIQAFGDAMLGMYSQNDDSLKATIDNAGNP